jgi:hypothetical protein
VYATAQTARRAAINFQMTSPAELQAGDELPSEPATAVPVLPCFMSAER